MEDDLEDLASDGSRVDSADDLDLASERSGNANMCDLSEECQEEPDAPGQDEPQDVDESAAAPRASRAGQTLMARKIQIALAARARAAAPSAEPEIMQISFGPNRTSVVPAAVVDSLVWDRGTHTTQSAENRAHGLHHDTSTLIRNAVIWRYCEHHRRQVLEKCLQRSST